MPLKKLPEEASTRRGRGVSKTPRLHVTNRPRAPVRSKFFKVAVARLRVAVSLTLA
jgi:hypothetical protein